MTIEKGDLQFQKWRLVALMALNGNHYANIDDEMIKYRSSAVLSDGSIQIFLWRKALETSNSLLENSIHFFVKVLLWKKWN